MTSNFCASDRSGTRQVATSVRSLAIWLGGLVFILAAQGAAAARLLEPLYASNPDLVLSLDVRSTAWDAFDWPARRLATRPAVIGGNPAHRLALDWDRSKLSIWDEHGRRLLPGQVPPGRGRPIYLAGEAPGDAWIRATELDGTGRIVASERWQVTVRWPSGLAARRVDERTLLGWGWIPSQTSLVVRLDPGRYRDREGLPYAVYVVPHRDAAGWAANPTLDDVTGGIESATVGSGEPLVVWPQASAGSIESTFDIVCDFGNDGRFDPGDVLDSAGISGPGLVVIEDLSLPGAFETQRFDYKSARGRDQRLTIPTGASAPPSWPIVAIGHAAGYRYTCYESLSRHLASHGWAVLASDIDTSSYLGSRIAGEHLLEDLDDLLGRADTLAGGALAGHLDSHRIVLIGHSRGGEAVVNARERLRRGELQTTHFSLTDLVGLIGLAPPVNEGTVDSTPGDAPYLLIYGASDTDVEGSPSNHHGMPFRIAEAGTGEVTTVYVHGMSHSDLSDCIPLGGSDGFGPDLIGPAAAHTVVNPMVLAFAHSLASPGSGLGRVLTSPLDIIRPPGLGAQLVLVSTRREPRESVRVIDDFRGANDLSATSRGMPVRFSDEAIAEGRLADANEDFYWTNNDPMNGMTLAAEPSDAASGVVFACPEGQPCFYELETPTDARDWNRSTTLSFRACQQSHAPETIALAAPLDLCVVITDGQGRVSRLDSTAYGRPPSPYLRAGGWANEFATLRIPAADFEQKNPALDLADIRAVRFELAGGCGSALARMGLADIELVDGQGPVRGAVRSH